MHPYLNIAIKTARIAGKIMIDAILHPNFKDLEQKIESVVANTILKAYPKHNINIAANKEYLNDSEITWLVDPLNGALNFKQGFPFFSISIAVIAAESIEHGVIYNPISDELFVASKGSGAQLNNKKIRCSSSIKIDESFVSIELALLDNQKIKNQQILNLINYRYLGSPALHLAFTAAGRLDGYCGNKLQPWEIAAGALLIKESGGYLTDFNGKLNFLNNGEIVAGNTKIYPTLLELCNL